MYIAEYIYIDELSSRSEIIGVINNLDTIVVNIFKIILEKISKPNEESDIFKIIEWELIPEIPSSNGKQKKCWYLDYDKIIGDQISLENLSKPERIKQNIREILSNHRNCLNYLTEITSKQNLLDERK